MKNKLKLSHQGIREIEKPEHVEKMKELFKSDFVNEIDDDDNENQKRVRETGYFIGKALLNRILSENEDAAGLVFSFGLNKSIKENGQIVLIMEAATGEEIDDEPNIISDREVYVTGGISVGGPGDGGIPAIKPKSS